MKNVLFITLACILYASTVHAQDLASLYSIEGRVDGGFAPNYSWKPIDKGQGFNVDDKVRTAARSRAGVRFSDGYLIRLGEKTSLTFKPRENESESISLTEGKAFFLSTKKRSFPRIDTPQISASVRGTEFVVEVSNNTTVVSVFSGEVFAENSYGSVVVRKDEQAVAEQGKAPVKSIIINQADAVQWSLYSPPMFEVSDFAGLLGSSHSQAFADLNAGKNLEARNRVQSDNLDGALIKSLSYYQEGKLSKAFSAISDYVDAGNTLVDMYATSLLLSIGDTESARASLETLNSASLSGSERSIYLAEIALVELVKSEKEAATKHINEALSQPTVPAPVYLVASYVAQANFDLEQAEGYVQKLLKIAPDHALGKARLAELELAKGSSEKALEILDTVDNDYAYGSVVRGFAYLTNSQLDAAVDEFNKAVNTESGNSLAQLGLGLAKIKSGSFDSGVRHLEYAVQLDPLVSLYRSYLGKAYYEASAGKKASEELARAMELDPNDPTPHLYRSYLNLTEHRPVAAMRDIQKSIQLNDNRAVYRSKLLLDADQGTRSSGLGQIFNRVGFTELARVEALKSLHKDYSNYSAHYLLADLYSQTHLNSRAQTTENLLGRALSPVTYNSNSINIGGDASLNEYTTLFDQPVSQFGISGLANSQSERLEGTVEYTSADYTVGHNIGYTHGYQGGFRENDFERNHQLFSIGQLALSPSDTLIWDAALTSVDFGDITVDFDPYEEDSSVETNLDSFLVRTGINHTFSPGTHFILQGFYNYGQTDIYDENESGRFDTFNVFEAGMPVTRNPFVFDGLVDEDLDVEQHLGRIDGQFIIDRELVSVVVGSSFRIDTTDSKEQGVITSGGSRPELSITEGFPALSDGSVTERSSRTFLYTIWHLTEELDVDAGITYATIKLSDNLFAPPFSDDTYSDNQLSPKFGFLYQLTETTNIRGAYSESLDRTQRGGIGSLEPTFVGGFNQVHDGVQGTEQEFWGVGIDQSFPATETWVGVNYQRREIDLNRPFNTASLILDRPTRDLRQVLDRDDAIGGAKEDRVGVYAYHILTDTLSFTIDYTWEHFDEIDPLPEVDTSRVASQLNYFHESGLFSFARASWREQKRAEAIEDETNNAFWLIDAGVGYEFDDRKGAITLAFNNIFDEEFNYTHTRDEDAIRPEFGAELFFSYTY